MIKEVKALNERLCPRGPVLHPSPCSPFSSHILFPHHLYLPFPCDQRILVLILCLGLALRISMGVCTGGLN